GPEGGGVVDQIRATGVQQLDAIFVSHSHIDHALGALDVMKRMRVAHLFGPPELRWQSGAQVIREAEREHVPFEALALGDTFDAGRIHVETLLPEDQEVPPFSSDAIDQTSLVLRATVDGVRVLLPGDIRSAQQEHVREYEDVTAQILVAPHHG